METGAEAIIGGLLRKAGAWIGSNALFWLTLTLADPFLGTDDDFIG
jgi:hypothetical protein